MRREEERTAPPAFWALARHSARTAQNGHSYWLCRCNCGTERLVYAGTLKNGASKSCGCHRSEVSKVLAKKHLGKGNGGATRTHGEFGGKTPEYRTWVGIRWRCRPSNDEKTPGYGGRGIRVCNRWNDPKKGYRNFLADMGRRPSPSHSLDRINVNKGCSPDNCRWATAEVQMNNRRKIARLDRFSLKELQREYDRRMSR